MTDIHCGVNNLDTLDIAPVSSRLAKNQRPKQKGQEMLKSSKYPKEQISKFLSSEHSTLQLNSTWPSFVNEAIQTTYNVFIIFCQKEFA